MKRSNTVIYHSKLLEMQILKTLTESVFSFGTIFAFKQLGIDLSKVTDK